MGSGVDGVPTICSLSIEHSGAVGVGVRVDIGIRIRTALAMLTCQTWMIPQ